MHIRPLKLKYEPSTANAPQFARDIVASTKRITGTELDYSPASLMEVDRILESFRKEGCTIDQIAETLF
jgi:hypothetical protein